MIAIHRWHQPPSRGTMILPEGEIHVWRVDLDQLARHAEHWAQMLSPDEHSRAERFHLEQNRRRFIVGRGCLRAILGNYLGMRPAHVEFRYGLYGKPTLSHLCDRPPLHFNSSHSDGFALHAVGLNSELGIDLERIRSIPEIDQIVEQFFSPEEKILLSTISLSDRQEAFFRCWTRKEAYLKACGVGFARPLDYNDILVGVYKPEKSMGNDHAASETCEVPSWSFVDLSPAEGYAASLAVRGANWRVVPWHCSGP